MTGMHRVFPRAQTRRIRLTPAFRVRRAVLTEPDGGVSFRVGQGT